MRLRIKHVTEYLYETPAALGPQIVRLRPAGHTRANVFSYNLDVSPESTVRWQHDPWANRIARVTFDAGTKVDKLRLEIDVGVEVRPVNPFDFFIDDRCEELPFQYPDGLEHELAPYLEKPAMTPHLAHFLEDQPARGHIVDFLVGINQKVANTVDYIIRMEPGLQTAEETLEIGSGSCRDSAALLVDALRARGIAARFCSGYLVQLTDEGNIPDMAKGVANDVVDLHAWAEAYVPGAGWIGLDGTSGLLCGEGHIPLAATVSPQLAAPISGTSSEPATGFNFEMSVHRLGHEPRPRKPYTDETWAAIVGAGDVVDATLQSRGLNLTIGGEPTWTSREHPADDEWNTEALGQTKWVQGVSMAHQLRQRFGVGTLAMRRMGKLYPGESLPRWALHLIWREDNVPVWRDPARLAFVDDLEAEVGPQDPEWHAWATETSQQVARRLADALSIHPRVVPGFEDPWALMKEEFDLPTDVDPYASDLDDPEVRRRVARILTRGVKREVGFALPLAVDDLGRWATSEWSFRRDRMFLIPGDSPMGLRLPLKSIGGVPVEYPTADPSRELGPLEFQPRRLRELRASEQGAAAGAGDQQAAAAAFPKDGVARTALVVEPRAGAIHVFLPPVPDVERFLELVATVEDVASDMDIQLGVEGYPPPADPRLQSCLVTPDPGVIEVNIPPARSFREYAETVAKCNDAANHAGLTTEKYQLDGREAGSGGGNHITMGGPTPAQSPFLNDPALLSSFLRFVQNHPSLSYVFSGLFVGPTSQAPRVDEARNDALYELELALRRVSDGGEKPYPWFVDRLLRNLLTDLSGNTHRAEISIDKLYDPNSPSGRQGLVEMRAFEMPPHEHMAAVQALVARALVARCAVEAYENPLVRWGSQLHDRFMLPHYLERDLGDVCDDFQRHGLPVDGDWFVPFLDYRFPVFGRQQLGDVELEIRGALEPWHTLGEQPEGPVVARYVDSSLERVQVKVRGLTEGRHAVLVNGRHLPMRSTGVASEKVAGVRFRAWQPPHCLQPHVPVHHPLRFDVVDTWSKRSMGASSYHVTPPGDRGFNEPPLTAFEAAARRAQRFTTEGHAPYPVIPEPRAEEPEQPFTLDLRQP